MLLLLVVTVASLVLADIAFRLYERHALTASYKPDGPVADLRSLNYNDSFVAKAKPAGELRILSFGDSFCHAIVQFPASYNGVLQSLLGRPGRPARVVNFGEPSSSFPQYICSMANWLPQVAHDAVLVNIFTGNDLAEAAYGEVPDDGVINQAMGDNFVDIQTGRKRMRHVPRVYPLRLMDYAWAYWLYFREGKYVLKDVPEPYTHALGPLDEEAFFKTCARHLESCDPESLVRLKPGYDGVEALGRFLAAKRREGVRVLVLISPAEVQVNPDLLARAAARLGRAPSSFDPDLPARKTAEVLHAVDPDIPVLDLRPALAASMKAGVNPYYPMETHWNVEGNRVAGRAVAEWITANWE